MRKKQHRDGEKGEELFGLGGMMRKAITKVLGRKHLIFAGLIQVKLLHFPRLSFY